jgi:peptide-methionine (S)-S-oxide reductase
MSAIFYHDTAQRRAAAQSKRQREQEIGETLHTQILPASTFFVAEDYHQKYRLRQVGFLFSELQAMYPHTADLVASTAAARINGYVAGYGTLSQLDSEIDGFGLSAEARRRLRQMVAGR